MRAWLRWSPLLAFAVLVVIVASELRKPSDGTIHSPLVGQPIPNIDVPPLLPGKPGLDATSFRRGRPRLLNVFASWCIPCIAEAPQLMRLKAMGIAIDAVAVRDTPQAVDGFLRRNGDPYVAIGDDAKNMVQLSLGSSGVPETFVIDGKGIIVEQHVGDIRADDVEALAAKVRAAR